MGIYATESARLALQTLTAEDHLDDFYAIQSNPEAMHWSTHNIHTTREQSLAQLLEMRPSPGKLWIQRWAIMLRSAATETSSTGKVTNKPKPKMIGVVGLVREAEIGYKIHPDYWGKGYMSEALALFLDLAWTLPAMETYDKLLAGADAENEKSMRVLEKAGFIKDRFEKEFYERAIDKGKGGKKRDMQYFHLDRPRSSIIE